MSHFQFGNHRSIFFTISKTLVLLFCCVWLFVSFRTTTYEKQDSRVRHVKYWISWSWLNKDLVHWAGRERRRRHRRKQANKNFYSIARKNVEKTENFTFPSRPQWSFLWLPCDRHTSAFIWMPQMFRSPRDGKTMCFAKLSTFN